MSPSADPLLDWLSVPSIAFPRLSPLRERLGFFWDPEGRAELFVLDVRGGRPTQVSHGEVPKAPTAQIVWAPDGRSIVFSKDTDGNELHDLYRIDVPDGRVTRLTDDPTCQRYALGFSGDGRSLLFASDKGVDGEARQLDLWRMRADGTDIVRIARHRQPVYLWVTRNLFAPDDRTIAYCASDEDDPRDGGVYLLRPASAEPELALHVRRGSRVAPTAWSPDSRTIAVVTDAYDFDRAGLLDVRSREVRWLGAGTADEAPIDFSPDGRSLLVTRVEGVRVHPVVYDLSSGEEWVVSAQLDFRGGAGFLGNSRQVLVVRTDSRRPHSVVVASREETTAREVMPPNFGPIPSDQVVPSEVVRYPSFDGRPIEALLYRPPRASPSNPVPAIVEAHGGPTWQFYDDFDVFSQYLVSRGFAVLRPNVRGSTGYGREFRDLNLMDLGGGDLKDVASASDFLRRQPFIDPDRVAIYGVSYGGYLTYAALTWYPHLWRAGVAIAGVTDWKRGYDEEVPDLQHYDRELIGDPVENAALYHDRSPVFFAKNVTAPILMIHGANDARCPVSHARGFRDALVREGRREGVDFEYLEFSDEGHSRGDREQYLRSYRPAFDFLERHLSSPDLRPT